ncbi:hypothetical protein ACXYMO_00145 [Arenibacterium sp. CAU 1754]
MTSEHIMGLAFVLLIAAVLIVFAASMTRNLVLPAMDKPAFALRENLLDALGAIILPLGLYELLGAYFENGGLLPLLERFALYTVSSLGIFGMIIILMFGLALRFCLRIAAIYLRRA